MVFCLSRYFHKLKGQLVANKKTYTIDPGLISATAFVPTDSLGALYENVVFLELLRRRDYEQSFDAVFFWQGKNCEVDFITRTKNRFQSAIQVSLDLTRPETREREKKALIAAHKDLKVGRYTIITESIEETWHESGIQISIVPLWKWLWQAPVPPRTS